MNVVLDEVEEIWIKDTKTKKAGDRNTLGKPQLLSFAHSRGLSLMQSSRSIGRLLLKGENITLIQLASPPGAKTTN